ncbi:MAG TPA: glycosyltransferase [Gemmatirosa sp.]
MRSGSTRETGPTTIAFLHRGQNWIRGSEQCLLDLIARLDRSRFHPLLICEQPTLARAAAADGTTVMQLDPADDWTVLTNRAARPALRARLREAFRVHDVRLVHANVTAVLPVVIPVARSARLPVVSHLHLPVTDEYERLHELVHQADVAVGVAQHVIEPLRHDGVREGRLRVVYNAVDTARLRQGETLNLRATLGIPADALVAVSIGSLIHRKAHDVTLRALAAARARGLDLYLLLCGDGEDATKLDALAGTLDVAPYVRFLGYRTDVGAIVRDTADIFITSAREETLGLNVLEAQWLGAPVIASDIPAHREALAADVSGLLVKVDDPEALARAIAEIAAAPERRAALGAAGPRVVAERFSMDRYVSAFEELYGELLARPRGEFGWVRGVYWPPAYTAWVRRNVQRRLRLGGTRASPVRA